MLIRIEDTEGRGATVEVAPRPPGERPGVGLLIEGPPGRASWACSPEAARELAAALVRAAGDAEDTLAEPVTVKARDLLRGDVRDGHRTMTVEAVRTDGANVQVTWTSGGGRSWSQLYEAGTDIRLRRRRRPES
ncbi:hypothetical protein CP967_31000 [Streptomyces nitrosporeus]|uniref:Uncharacterized protein n=1 Tax=Streptomyces nitrosporeus TaxID=28894 RepID=A0A5J6FLS2_9ACTN|nr:hypothetical protein [Streptomyces nitrosporeus]QEU75810.1 hypothetical protein CP967_31000 [Streptomyces nitrosporeus]GGY88380.1 hypothetical protein GCM10010327_18880 [Streptomyces nitrosporeus]